MAKKDESFDEILNDIDRVSNEISVKAKSDERLMDSITKNPTQVTFTDYTELLNQTNNSVRPIVEAFCQSYVTEENMTDPKVQQRVNIDCMALSDIIWKKTVSDLAVIRIMEKLESGDDDFKMFTAFASVMSTKNNIPKELLQTMMVLEKNYKDLKSELFEKNKLSIDNVEDVNTQAVTARGSRQLLQALKNVKEYQESKNIIEQEEFLKNETDDIVEIIKPGKLAGSSSTDSTIEQP